MNDQYRGLGEKTFRAGFLDLLSRASGYARGEADRVVIVSIPDWGVTSFASSDRRGPNAIASEIDRFNAAAKEESLKIGATFVDVTQISREARTNRALLAADGLHPSGEMYTKWVAVIEPVASRSLSK